MDIPSANAIQILNYLLPGFIAASIVYNLTPNLRPSPFERVVQALILTLPIQALTIVTQGVVLFVGSSGVRLGTWGQGPYVVWSVTWAVVFGLFASKALNYDLIHKRLREWEFTFQTSFPSEWYGVFSATSSYVVLHLAGGRRLYGWPEEWPNASSTGHFVLVQAEWLTNEGRRELPETEKILVRAVDVEMVEFVSSLQKDPING